MTRPSGGLWGAVRRVFSTHEQREGERRTAQMLDVGAEPLNQCADRSNVVVSGTISSLRVNKQGGSGWLEAVVSDGTGTLTLVWMGRKKIPGVEAGRSMLVSGRLSRRGDDLVLYNPEYSLLP